MVKLNSVKKNYKDFQLDCSMEIKKGQITGLVGRNGAGKSTTFKAMLGLIKADEGSIEIFGKSPDRLTAKDRQKIGVVMSDTGFRGALTINDLAAILKGFYSDFSSGDFKEMCRRFELPLNKKLAKFSTGMNRKLHILAAISHNAQLLILDEPTAGLDAIVRDEILGMLREYMENGERSIVISSHISSDLERLCDDLYMIEKGKIVLHEDMDIILDEYGLLKLTPEQYGKIDKKYIIKSKQESFGYECLTNNTRFYRENYPDVVIERGNIDEVIINLAKA